MSSDELRAVLAAYLRVMQASWPALHPRMADRSLHWRGATEAALRAELDGYLAEAAPPHANVRVFWKLGPKLLFAGGNQLFAQDAGFARIEDLIGIDDFDKRLPWRHQAAKYRSDDEDVVQQGSASLDILERQHSATGGITWVRAGKAAIRTENGSILGVFGMYELLDGPTGRKLFAERLPQRRSPD